MSLPADDQLEAVFGADGALGRAIPGYRLRPQQVEMAHTIAAALRDNSLLVAEAGTGTGKTFAYLVPALLSGGKVHHLAPAPRACRTSSSSATCRSCARRSGCR